MTLWWVMPVIFVAVFVLCFWSAAGAARSRNEFNSRWNAHDVHWDPDRGQWRHEGACPCGKGPYPIRLETRP